jgi:hypothetical protein
MLMAKYLVLANQTLGGAELDEEIRKRLKAGPSSFYVLVPATRPSDYPVPATGMEAGSGGSLPMVARATGPGPASDQEATAHAQHRLGQLLDELRRLGAEADGELGHPDPLRAVGDVMATRSFDEIILSTLPQPISKWLAMDLPHRLQRRFDLPVTTVIAKQ